MVRPIILITSRLLREQRSVGRITNHYPDGDVLFNATAAAAAVDERKKLEKRQRQRKIRRVAELSGES